MSLPIEEVIESVKRIVPNIPSSALIAIENDLEAKEAEVKADKQNVPKVKNTLVTVLLDPQNQITNIQNITSLVIQIPEGQDAGQTLDRLYAAVYDQKAASKRKVKNINSVQDAAFLLKRRFSKNHNIHIKTKEPVRVLISNDIIPTK